MRILIPQRRFTLAAFIASALATFAAEGLIDQVWRGIAPTNAPAMVHVVIASAFGLLWIAPLVIWMLSVRSYGGRLMRSALPATPAIVFTWGFFALFFTVQFSRSTNFGVVFLEAILSGFAAVAATLIVDRHRLVAVAFAGVAGWASARALDAASGLTAHSIHEAHLRGFLSAVRVEDRAWWTLVIAATVSLAALYGMDATLDALRRRIGGSPAYDSPRPSVAESPTTPDFPFSRYDSSDQPVPGFYAKRANAAVEDLEAQLLEAKRAAERTARGDEAEHSLFTETAVLLDSGWKLKRNYFLEGVKIGDVDLLAISPNGDIFAIDAKLRSGASIIFDQSLNDLVAVFRSGKRDEGEFIKKARYQADVLTKHSGWKVRPVICFINSTLECPKVVNGVVITTLNQIVMELRAAVDG